MHQTSIGTLGLVAGVAGSQDVLSGLSESG
jgi:hypothetical protein